ncbi:hypothetical protein J4406_01800 [Candidatus Woesearchaeota archaeon]|nr:hypothetical protein [Candidatus Woesearchaeota archaeon]
MKLKGLASIALSFLIGCSGPKTIILERGIYVKYRDENFCYHYLEIGSTGYYVMGISNFGSFSKISAEIDAEKRLWKINNYCKPTLEDLRNVDRIGNISLVIEHSEYEKMMDMALWRDIVGRNK